MAEYVEQLPLLLSEKSGIAPKILFSEPVEAVPVAKIPIIGAKSSFVSPSVSQQKPVSPSVSQQKPVSPSVSQQKPVSPSVSQQKPVSPSVSQQKPVSPSVSQQKPVVRKRKRFES